MIAPDTYVGSIEPEEVETFVLETSDASGTEAETKDEVRIVNKKIQIVPALYKIYDEVLVNAADHWKRLLTHSKDPSKPKVAHQVVTDKRKRYFQKKMKRI